MRRFKNKFISILTLLAILSVAFSSLWVAQAEAKLGIEICSAQGVQTIYIDNPSADKPDQQHQPSRNIFSHCLICSQTDQDQLVIDQSANAVSCGINGASLILPYSKTIKYINSALSDINPRAPPFLSA